MGCQHTIIFLLVLVQLVNGFLLSKCPLVSGIHDRSWNGAASSAMGAIAEGLPDESMMEEVLKVAIEAAKKAGEIMISNAGGVDVVEKKSTDRDLLTLIDPLCEKVSKHQLRSPRLPIQFTHRPRLSERLLNHVFHRTTFWEKSRSHQAYSQPLPPWKRS